ncbi:MFS general substrate transporter [Biscogniauxia mediterranea]|nr:MFS general substrate transporter [Biscogniauxia mediterranea]
MAIHQEGRGQRGGLRTETDRQTDRHTFETRPEKLGKQWNCPPPPGGNVPKVAACFWSFILVMGLANDAAYGGEVPPPHFLFFSVIKEENKENSLLDVIQAHYKLTYLVVSLIFLASFVGYTAAAFLNNAIHMRFLGFLYGLYGAGAVISTLVATTMTTKGNLPWYSFYYIMIGMAAIEIVTSVAGFWKATAHVYIESLEKSSESANGRLKEAPFQSPSACVAWLCALTQGELFASGMTATGFWLGLAIGRLILGFVTPRIGEKLAIMIYLPLAMGLELVFWLVPQFIVSAVAVGLQGFFYRSPLLLPRQLHVGAIGFAAAFGDSGAAVLPFAVGAIAQVKGVQVLQPVILVLLGVILLLWTRLPRISEKRK